MIFQDYRLLKDRNIFENIALPLHVMGYGRKEVYERVNNVIIDVGLNGKEKRKPNELSGGEQQKACIARALVKEPKIILADEPSANLDPDAAGDLLELLKDIHSRGTLVLMATHQWQHFYFDLIKDWDYRIFNIENGYMVQ